MFPWKKRQILNTQGMRAVLLFTGSQNQQLFLTVNTDGGKKKGDGLNVVGRRKLCEILAKISCLLQVSCSTVSAGITNAAQVGWDLLDPL